MTSEPDKSDMLLLQAFQNVCAVLEKENELLLAGDLKEVVALLPMKQQEMQALEDILSTKEEQAADMSYPPVLPPEAEDAAKRFGALVKTNRKLLKNAIDAQNALIKLIVVDAAQDTSTGYVASGRYAIRTGPQGVLALRSDV